MEELTYFNANVLIYLNASQYSTAISIPPENVRKSQLLFPLKLSENHRLSDVFRGI